jgi:hypothetical protein
MIARGKLVTSSVRAAAFVAGAVILLPFLAFADSVPAIPDQISLAPFTPPLILVEGGKAADFVLTVQNISKPKNLIGIKNVSVVAVLTDGTDKSDTIVLPIPQPYKHMPQNHNSRIRSKMYRHLYIHARRHRPQGESRFRHNLGDYSRDFLSESRQPQFSCADAQGIFRVPSPPVPSF